MDKQAQDKLWNELSEESKERILSINKELDEEYEKYKKEGEDNLAGYSLERAIMLENLFGEHNLNPEPPTPKTWEDFVKEFHKETDWNPKNEFTDLPLYGIDDKVKSKIIATAKITKLIDLGYGGAVTKEEWCNNNIEKWTIVYHPRSNTFDFVRVNNNIHFITFHTLQQAEEFMSYESNRKLVEQYYMV